MGKAIALATIIFVLGGTGVTIAEECANVINERMYDSLVQLKATEGSGDRERMCKATRRIVAEARAAKMVGCTLYSAVSQKYQDIIDKNCKPYGY